MAGSLRDQLLKAGLVDEKKAKQAAKEKREEQKTRHHEQKQAGKQAPPPVDATKQRAAEARAAQAERDREANRRKQENAARKALYSEVRQLVQANTVERKGGTLSYRFRDGAKIEKIYVTDVLQQQLARGQLGIARIGKEYLLVTADAWERLAARDPENATRIRVALATPDAKPAEDDPYAQFQVPDDLTW